VRKIWWAAAFIAVVSLGCVLALTRHREDDFAILRPYIVSEEHKFHKPQYSSPTDTTFYETVLMHARRVPDDMQARFVASLVSKGWQPVRPSRTLALSPTALYKGNSVKSPLSSFLIVGSDVSLTSPYLPHSLMVYEYRPMSTLEVWLLRMRHLGSDPFQKLDHEP